MCSLNSPEEVTLAEKLIELHPWAEMARFARTGGEACAVAVRIARAAAGKTKIAFCGYHGWHDWYLAANLGDESNLDEQLLPGLAPKGVARELKDTILPFRYNHLDELEVLYTKYPNEIGVIIMEPQRGNAPAPGFLEGVRSLASKIGAVLIFDEVTSGFRMNLGGIHLTYGVEPDVAVFAKALGNGFPISAIIGRRSVMDAAQNTFVSSTMWTERIGFVSALAAIQKMEKLGVQKDMIRYGEQLNAGWNMLAQKHELKIHVSGVPPLTHISFVCDNSLAVQTLYAQEMLTKGYLLGSAVYTTHAYTDEIIVRFIEDSDPVFGLLKQAIGSGNIRKYLKGDVIHAGFKRLA
jgi:glutamate-1-semialdehyde 2,1-aminomutase